MLSFLIGLCGVFVGMVIEKMQEQRRMRIISNALDSGYFQNMLMVKLADVLFYRFPGETFEIKVRDVIYRVFRRNSDIVYEAK